MSDQIEETDVQDGPQERQGNLKGSQDGNVKVRRRKKRFPDSGAYSDPRIDFVEKMRGESGTINGMKDGIPLLYGHDKSLTVPFSANIDDDGEVTVFEDLNRALEKIHTKVPSPRIEFLRRKNQPGETVHLIGG